jgi:nucleotide-binding universal stress UspA family protein
VYNNILVPYDSSRASDLALDHAARLSKALGGAQVVMLHVVPEIPVARSLNPALRLPDQSELEELYMAQKMVSAYEVVKKAAALELEMKKQEYLRSGVKIRYEVLVGHVVDTIVEFARKERVDLIVISNVGSGKGANPGIMGSVSRSVAERALCPVMIVR